MNTQRFGSPLTLAVFLVITGLIGCKDGPITVDPCNENISNGRIDITQCPEDLGDRIIYYPDPEVPLDSSDIPPGRLGKVAGPGFTLTLRAEVLPPVSGTTTLQATHIVMTEYTDTSAVYPYTITTYSLAYVSYNVGGPTYLGGVDVFDVTSRNNPTLISSAVFLNTDVSALTFNNGKLYLAESTSDVAFTYPAVVEEITLVNNRLSLMTRRTGIASYVATDVKVAFGKVFASSGSGGPGTGGLTVLDAGTLTEVAFDPFLDARAVNVYGNNITVMQGTPARIRMYNGASSSFMTSYNVGGANLSEHKSTAKVVGNRAFVAAGDEGLKVVDLTTGSIVDSLPRVTVAGLDPNLTVTNSVSVNGDLVFLANGEAGVYVAQAAFDLEKTPTGNPNLQLLGKMQFGTQQSVNFVESEKNLIFIAGGLGGLKIVQVKVQ